MVKKFEPVRAQTVEKQAVDLYAQGKSIRAISDQIGASRSYVHRLLMRRRTEALKSVVSSVRVREGDEPLPSGNAISMGAIMFHNRRYAH